MFTYEYKADAKDPFPTLAEGEAHFEIESATTTDEKTGQPLLSKKGNPMMKLVLKCSDKFGNSGRVFDYIVDTVIWKLDQLGSAIGLDIYTPAGILNPAILVGKKGKVMLKQEEYNGRSSAKVDAYVDCGKELKKVDVIPAFEEGSPFDDVIPF